MAINSDPQLRLDEQALDDWSEAREALRGPRERYALLQGQPGDYRCGKFRIKVGTREAKTVELFGEDD